MSKEDPVLQAQFDPGPEQQKAVETLTSLAADFQQGKGNADGLLREMLIVLAQYDELGHARKSEDVAPPKSKTAKRRERQKAKASWWENAASSGQF